METYFLTIFNLFLTYFNLFLIYFLSIVSSL